MTVPTDPAKLESDDDAYFIAKHAEVSASLSKATTTLLVQGRIRAELEQRSRLTPLEVARLAICDQLLASAGPRAADLHNLKLRIENALIRGRP